MLHEHPRGDLSNQFHETFFSSWEKFDKDIQALFNGTGMACYLIGANDWKALENQFLLIW